MGKKGRGRVKKERKEMEKQNREITPHDNTLTV